MGNRRSCVLFTSHSLQDSSNAASHYLITKLTIESQQTLSSPRQTSSVCLHHISLRTSSCVHAQQSDLIGLRELEDEYLFDSVVKAGFGFFILAVK